MDIHLRGKSTLRLRWTKRAAETLSIGVSSVIFGMAVTKKGIRHESRHRYQRIGGTGTLGRGGPLGPLARADLAEPLGFDSLFGLEHHFTGYSMSPHPLQLLSYYAAKTKKITLGTCVIVLPWHDPIRVAEQIAYLDLLCGGRCMFGFGRGAASVEYAGFRIPMEEARPRFAEAAQLVTTALRDEVFEWDGEFYKIPKMSIRPRPMSNPERRFYASSVSPESAEIMAKLGFGMMVIMQNEWSKAAADIHDYRSIAERWPQSAAAGRPDQCLLCGDAGRSPGTRHAVPWRKVGFYRLTLQVLGRASR